MNSVYFSVNNAFDEIPLVKSFLKGSLRDGIIRNRFNYGLNDDNVSECVSFFYTNECLTLEISRERFSSVWGEVNDSFMKSLFNVIGAEFPADFKIEGRVSFLPVCPRFLNNYSFNVNFDSSNDFLKSVVSHEVCHFLYFKKWCEVFTDYSFCDDFFEKPSIEWYLSEVLAPVILNDSRIKSVLNVHAKGHDHFYKSFINGESVFDFFTNLYVNHEGDFSSFLSKAWIEALNHKFELII